MKSRCDMCGMQLQGGIGMGNALVCRSCAPDLEDAIRAKHTAGEPVNALRIAKGILRQSAGDYFWRDIPDRLFHALKARAALEGLDVREVLTRLVEQYLKKGG